MNKNKTMIIIAITIILMILGGILVFSNNDIATTASEKSYYELDPTNQHPFIEVVVNNDYTYSIYSYANVDDYENETNKTLLETVTYKPENEFKINVTDIVKSDFPISSLTTVLTEDFDKNKFLNLDLTQETTELLILSNGSKNNIYFQVGLPTSNKVAQLTPLFSTSATDFVIECRLTYGEYTDEIQKGYSLFASLDKQTSSPTSLILNNKTEEDKLRKYLESK